MGIAFLVVLIIVIPLAIWYRKMFNSARAAKQKMAEEQRMRHGGESVLEWSGSYADGEPDNEFGRLVVRVPKKRGDGGACFYEKGLVCENKRLPYSEIKDIIYSPVKPGIKLSVKQAVQDRGYMWIYQKKGRTIGIGGYTYRLDNEIMEKIQKGLGFADKVE